MPLSKSKGCGRKEVNNFVDVFTPSDYAPSHFCRYITIVDHTSFYPHTDFALLPFRPLEFLFGMYLLHVLVVV